MYYYPDWRMNDRNVDYSSSSLLYLHQDVSSLHQHDAATPSASWVVRLSPMFLFIQPALKTLTAAALALVRGLTMSGGKKRLANIILPWAGCWATMRPGVSAIVSARVCVRLSVRLPEV